MRVVVSKYYELEGFHTYLFPALSTLSLYIPKSLLKLLHGKYLTTSGSQRPSPELYWGHHSNSSWWAALSKWKPKYYPNTKTKKGPILYQPHQWCSRNQRDWNFHLLHLARKRCLWGVEIQLGDLQQILLVMLLIPQSCHYQNCCGYCRSYPHRINDFKKVVYFSSWIISVVLVDRCLKYPKGYIL